VEVRNRLARSLAVLTSLCTIGVFSVAATQEVILDTTGFWRMHHVIEGPVLQESCAPKTIPHFDDSSWVRAADRSGRGLDRQQPQVLVW
jgi:hypothetical protein